LASRIVAATAVANHELWLPAGAANIRLAVIAGRTCAADIVP